MATAEASFGWHPNRIYALEGTNMYFQNPSQYMKTNGSLKLRLWSQYHFSSYPTQPSSSVLPWTFLVYKKRNLFWSWRSISRRNILESKTSVRNRWILFNCRFMKRIHLKKKDSLKIVIFMLISGCAEVSSSKTCIPLL